MGNLKLVFKVNNSLIPFISNSIFSSFLYTMKVKVTFATIVCFLHSHSLHYLHFYRVSCTSGWFFINRFSTWEVHEKFSI